MAGFTPIRMVVLRILLNALISIVYIRLIDHERFILGRNETLRAQRPTAPAASQSLSPLFSA